MTERLIGRWKDPATGIVHSRMLGTKKLGRKRLYNFHRNQGMRPSCGNGGMRATLRREEFNCPDPITCDACVVIVERSLGLGMPKETT